MKSKNAIPIFLIIFFLSFCLLEPNCFRDNAKNGGVWSFIHSLFGILRYVATFVSLLLVPPIIIRRPSKIFCLIILYYTIIIISSFLNGVLTKDILMGIIPVISISIVTEYFVGSSNLKIFCQAFAFLLSIFVVINLFTIIFFPEGMYINERGWNYCFFLGYKNDHINRFLPLIFFVGITKYMSNTASRSFLPPILIIVLLSSLLIRSTTSLLVISVLIFLIIVAIRWKFPRWANVNLFYLAGLLFSIFFVGVVIGGGMTDYSSAVAEMADKEGDTIAARGLIWIDALSMIIQHPFTGNGTVTFLSKSWYEFGHAHNLYVDLMVMGGVSLLFVSFLQIMEVSKKMRIINNNELHNIILFIFLAYIMEFISEGRRTNLMWFVVLIVTCQLPSYIKIHQNDKNVKLE